MVEYIELFALISAIADLCSLVIMISNTKKK